MKSRYKEVKEAYDKYYEKKDSIINTQEMVYVLQDISETLALLYDRLCGNEIDSYKLP